MSDVFHQKPEHDTFFSSFATDLGCQLDRLRSEYEAIENGTIKEEPDEDDEDATDAATPKSSHKFQGSITNDTHVNEPKERTRTYTVTIQRAFSTVSLMSKTNFWKRRLGKNKNSGENSPNRRPSTSSTPEKNNYSQEAPSIKINGESEERASTHSEEPSRKKSVQRSHTMSPSKLRRSRSPNEPEQMEHGESGKVFVPPVIMNGKVMYEYQYVTPETSPAHKSADLRRSNSISKILRIVKSPKKSPKKDKNASPIKALYEKTVLTASAHDLYKSTLASNYLNESNGKSTQGDGEAAKDNK